jgi:RNA polymerase sigma-70 factor (ECF subfamily)
VAVNSAISGWRRRRRLRPLDDTAALTREDDPGLRHEVERALRTLPVKQRHALLLHHVVGLSVAEVAREMGAPDGTVKSWLSRGRESLQRMLSKEEEEPHG